MSHISKVVSLAATALLVFVGGIALAADPKLPTTQTPSTPTQLLRPDLVPWNGQGYEGKIGVAHFSCANWPFGFKVLQIMGNVRNIGNAATTAVVKTHVKINGSNWDEPHTFQLGPGIGPGVGNWFLKASGTLGPGTYTLWMKVDSENAQAELNENNNEATATTTCSGP